MTINKYRQYTPLNRVTLGPGHFDPIKRNKGVGSINRSKLTLFIWFCLLPSDPINQLDPINGGSINVTILYMQMYYFAINTMLKQLEFDI